MRPLTTADLLAVGLPPAYWGAQITQLPPATQQVLTPYLARMPHHLSEGRVVLVNGDIGAGKTTSAAIILKQARSCLTPGMFTTVSELRDTMRGRPSYDETPAIERAKEVGVLVLDGLRAEDRDAPILGPGALDDLITHRLGYRKITVLTTTLTAAELRESFPTLCGKLLGGHHFVVQGPNRWRKAGGAR